MRHTKYKTRGANELAPIMLERLLSLASNAGDLVIDPFGGSGTTFYAAEKLGRHWLGIEIGETEGAVARLADYTRGHYVEWESARGLGNRKRNGSKQMRMFERDKEYPV